MKKKLSISYYLWRFNGVLGQGAPCSYKTHRIFPFNRPNDALNFLKRLSPFSSNTLFNPLTVSCILTLISFPQGVNPDMGFYLPKIPGLNREGFAYVFNEWYEFLPLIHDIVIRRKI